MKKFFQLLVFAIVSCIAYSCSVKKDSFVNRSFHAITTKYNVLFNGNEAFKEGLKEIEDKHEDNFWKRLEIEPITFDDKVIAAPTFQSTDDDDDDSANLTKFDKAEDKARKAIETHSMNIDGYEKNRQIDDAYLLLGKSRYYTQRFIPAIEAFNYIIVNYPKADLVYDTKIWRAKSNIRLENEKFAIESLKLLLELDKNEKTLTDLQREQAHTAMAMAYEKTDTIQKVIEHLALASRTFKNPDQSARNMFILGQVYSELNRKDSAVMVFKKLADLKKAPYKYRIRANIEMAKNIQNDSAALGALYRLRKLIKNSDNRKFLAPLYYQAGVLEQRRGATDKAIEFFKKSASAKHNTEYQKTYAYESLGNIAFDQEKYLLAGSYYDSVLQFVPKEFTNEKRIRRIKRKDKGLTNLKKYEDIVANNDSILKLVAMSDLERTTFFENYIEKIKKEDEEKRQLLLNSQNFGSAFGGSNNPSFGGNSGKWYFYNNQAKSFGVGEFQKTWGNRPLEDNWRLSDKSITTEGDIAEASEDNEDQVNKRYELATYLDAIPSDQKKIEKLEVDRNDALYQLGLIYKEQFKNDTRAIANLERLNSLRKDDELELPISYHLYQLYSRTNQTDKATASKNIILNKYASSPFAEIILNPKKKINADKKEDDDYLKYKEFYYLYKENKFEEVVNQINNYNPINTNSNLIPKFTLLKALAIGKYQDKESYKKALDFVALSYPNTDEGKRAKEIRLKIE